MLTNQRSARWMYCVHALAALVLVAFQGPLAAQSASIGGSVLSDSTERRLANAEVLLTNLNRSTRTDSAGNFVFSGLAAGKHSVVVRLVGFDSYTANIIVKANDKFEADFLLKPTTTKLEKVEVKAAAPFAAKLAEFEERRATSVGKFLTAADFENTEGRSVSVILREKIAGVKTVQVNGRSWLASLRGGKMYSCKPTPSRNPPCPAFEEIPPACYMQVVVNGVIRYNGQPGQQFFDVDELNAKDIIGFEFYTTATTPLQYNATRGAGMSSCGTVIIWTKY